MNDLMIAANKALDNLEKAYPVKQESIQDKKDRLINKIEERYDFHVCDLAKTEIKYLARMLTELGDL